MTDEKDLEGLPDEVLRTFEGDAPPDGFADRVMTAWAEERSASVDDERLAADVSSTRVRPAWRGQVRLGRALPALASAAAAVLVMTTVQRWPTPPAEGAHVATARAELSVGERAVAVVEPGADLSWRVARGGDAVVEQRRGRAFYRVERGGAFVVKTPNGDAWVTGTSFSLEVNEMATEGTTGRRGALLAGAAAGAVVTAAVLLTVYEGSVVLSRGDAEVEVRAGERAEVVGDGEPSKLPSGDGHAKAFEQQLLVAERRALKEKVRDLEERLKDVMVARSRGEDPLALEARACEQRLAVLERELDVEQQIRSELEGETVPFPEDLHPRYQQDALKTAFMDIFARSGLAGDVVGIDCSEYPCVVYGDYAVEGDAAAKDDAFRKLEALLHEHYPPSTNGHSIRSSTQRDGKSGESKTMFGISVLQKDQEPSDEVKKNMHRRLQHRNQQFFEATWGGR